MRIRNIILIIAFSGLLSGLISGCANNDLYSGDVYNANQAKQVQYVSYGTITSVRPIQIQAENNNNAIGTIGGAVLGGLIGNAIGGGSGQKIATAAGAIGGGLAGSQVEGALGKSQGVELEIRRQSGEIIAVVQKDPKTKYYVGQKVRIVTDGSQVTVSPR